MDGSNTAAVGDAGAAAAAAPSPGSDSDGDSSSSSSAVLLTPAVLSAAAEHLAPADLLRLSLASRAAAAALAVTPRLWSGAAASALGWKGAAPPAAAPASATAAPGAAQAWHDEGAACHALMAAAAALAGAAAPHALHPQRHTSSASVMGVAARGQRYARADPRALAPPLSLTAAQQWLLTLGGPDLRVSLCSASPRTRARCAAAVTVDAAGRPGVVELYLSTARAPPLPAWSPLVRPPAQRAGRRRGGCDGSGSSEDGDDGSGGGNDGGDGENEGAPFDLFLADGAEWRGVRAALQAAIERNAIRARATRCAAVLHPATAGFSLSAIERALARLRLLGFPVLDLRRLVRADVPAVTNCGTEPPVAPAEAARCEWAAYEEAVRAEALGGAWAGSGLEGGTAALEAASQALARAVAALPRAAPKTRALVLPVLAPSHGRVGRAQPGRGSAHAFAAPRLLALNAPFLGRLRAAIPQLPDLDLVLVMCSGSSSGSAQVANGIVRSLVASCLDRHLNNE